MSLAWQPLPVEPSLLGESPFWHPDEGALYWCDIPGRKINRFVMASGAHAEWAFDSEPASVAPLPGGELLVAFRDGLHRFSPTSGQRTRVAPPPYDPREERFNDGKADPQGRFWVGTIHERRQPHASLYRFGGGRLERVAGDIANSNGLGFSPDGRTLYWADTAGHRVHAFDLSAADGSLSRRRTFAEFPPKPASGELSTYGGRPDGAAVDAEGAYWCALYEGGRLLRFAPDGTLLAELPLPARCPTMPCFGGPDLRTLFVTTARDKRPAEELAALPWSGRVLMLRVDVPGLPVNFARG